MADHIRRISVDTVEREVAGAPAGACYLVLTHEHALDLRITEAILRRGDFAYCGLIGSKTKRATFARRLAERGVPAAAIERLDLPDRRRRHRRPRAGDHRRRGGRRVAARGERARRPRSLRRATSASRLRAR